LTILKEYPLKIKKKKRHQITRKPKGQNIHILFEQIITEFYLFPNTDYRYRRTCTLNMPHEINTLRILKTVSTLVYFLRPPKKLSMFPRFKKIIFCAFNERKDKPIEGTWIFVQHHYSSFYSSLHPKYRKWIGVSTYHYIQCDCTRESQQQVYASVEILRGSNIY